MTTPIIALQECAFSQLGKLDYSFARGTLPESSHPFLVIRLSGSGSNRREEIGVYSYASAIVMAALEAWEPWAAILDLTHFEYEWGDRMSNVLAAPQRWYQTVHPLRAIFGGGGADVPEQLPFGIVVSERNREPIASLASEYMHADILMRASLDEVVRELDAKLKGVLGA